MSQQISKSLVEITLTTIVDPGGPLTLRFGVPSVEFKSQVMILGPS